MDEAKTQAEIILATAKAIVEGPDWKRETLLEEGAKAYGAEADANGFDAAVAWQVALLRKSAKREARKAEKAAYAAA